MFIPNDVWVRGALYNNKSNLLHNNNPTNNKISKLMFQLKKNINLIVILDEIKNINIINEGYLTKIPIITLNSNLNIQFEQSSYKVPGNFKFTYKNRLNNIHNSFLYSMLISILKKKKSNLTKN